MLVRSDGKIYKHIKKPLSTNKSQRMSRNQKTCKVAPRPIVRKDVLYEVERVIQTKIHNGDRLYLVKWTGYNSDENSWIEELPAFFKNEDGTWAGDLKSHMLSDSESEPDDELEDTSGDESEDEWIATSEGVVDSASDYDSGDDSDDDPKEHDSSVRCSQVPRKVEASKKTKKLYKHDSLKSTGTSSHREKTVMKALVALSAVVTAGYACDSECESD